LQTFSQGELFPQEQSCEGQVLQPSPLSPSFTHYLPCSRGNTALQVAVDYNKHNVAEYLRKLLKDNNRDVAEFLRHKLGWQQN
jgi:hypothetical protein